MNGKKKLSLGLTRRFGGMLKVDLRRMLTTPLFPIMAGIALMMPILILVMTTMVGKDGGMAFENAWQVIGSSGGMMAMDMTAMVNINLVFIMAGLFGCLFTAEDFRSGYVKNLFTVRARKTDYIASKTVTVWMAGSVMLLAFLMGTIIGGSIAGLPFTLPAGALGLVMCILSKILLMGVFASMAVAASAVGKSRSWMSILIFLFAGMLLFMMIPMLTPLNAGIMNVVLCLAGSTMFALGLGAVSRIYLEKKDLI